MFHVCHTFLFCGHLLGKGWFLALLCVMFSCVFVTFPCDGLCKVWYLIVLIPDLCILPYFTSDLPKMPFHLSRSIMLLYFYGKSDISSHVLLNLSDQV